MEPLPKLAWEALKGVLVTLIAVFSLALLYEVAGDYQGKELSVRWVVLTIFPATYLWWMVERLLTHLGVKASAGFSLLIALALSVWLLVVSERLQLYQRAGSLVDVVWGGLEATVFTIRRLLP